MSSKPRKVANKGSRQEMLPNRHALARLTGGDPTKRTINQYAKATPGPRDRLPDMNQMAEEVRPLVG